MQILQVKTDEDFNTSEIPVDALLVYPELSKDGKYVLKYKNADGETGTLTSDNTEINHATLAKFNF